MTMLPVSTCSVAFLLPNCFILLIQHGIRDLGWQQRYKRFCGRIVVLSFLVFLLYPFLLAWTVIGTLWFTRARNCVSSFCSSSLNTVMKSFTVNQEQSWYPKSFSVAWRRSEVGFSDLAALQLLWTSVHCLLVYRKG